MLLFRDLATKYIVIAFLILKTSPGHCIPFPFATGSGGTTFLSAGIYTTSGSGSVSAGSAVSSPDIYNVNSFNSTITENSSCSWTYTNPGASSNWMKISGGGLHTINLQDLAIQISHSVVINEGASTLNINVSGSRTHKGLNTGIATYRYQTGTGTLTTSGTSSIEAAGAPAQPNLAFASISTSPVNIAITENSGISGRITFGSGGGSVTLSGAGTATGTTDHVNSTGPLTININGTGTFTTNGDPNNRTTLTGGPGQFNALTVGTGVNYTANPLVNFNAFGVAGTYTTSAAISGINVVILVSSSGVLNLNHAYTGVGFFSNDGTINIATNNGLGLTGSSTNRGTININSGGVFSKPSTYTNSGTTNLNGGGSLNTAYTGSAGSVLNIGFSSSATPASINYTPSGTISGIPTIGLFTSGTVLNVTSAANAISGVNTAFTLATGTTATLGVTNAITGTGSTTNAGTINNNATDAFAITGTLTNTGTVTMNGGLTRYNPVINNGGTFSLPNYFVQSGSSFAMNGGFISGASNFGINNTGNFDYTGGTINLTGFFTVANQSAINVNNASFTKPPSFTNYGITNLNGPSATINGAYHGSYSTAQLNIGQTRTTGLANAAASYTTSGNITGPLAITVKSNGSRFTLASPNTTTGTGSITIENGGFGNLAAGSTNAFPISNYGLLSVSTASAGTATNSAQITNQSTGAILIASGYTLSNGALLTNNSKSVNQGILAFSIAGTLSGSGFVDNYGTTFMTGNLQQTGLAKFNNKSGGEFYISNGAGGSITSEIINETGGLLQINANSHGSANITNSAGARFNIGNASSPTFTLDTGVLTNNALYNSTTSGLIIEGTLNGTGSVINTRYTFLSGSLGIAVFNNTGATSELELRNGSNSITSTITNDGSIYTNGSFVHSATLSATGVINNKRNITIYSGTTLNNNGAINNITAGSSSDAQRVITVSGSIGGTGTVTNNASNGAATNTITYANATSVSGFAFTGLFTNSGIFNVNESLTRSSATTQTNANAVFNIADGKTFTNSSSAFNFTGLSGGTIQATGTGIFNNSGTVTVSTDVTNTSNFINSGTMTVDSTFTLTHNNYSGSQLRTLTNNSLLTVNGTITGSGAIVNNSATGSAFTINGSVNGAGGITNSSGAILNIANGLNNILRDTSNAGRIIITGNSRITGAITNNSLSANAQSLTINSGVTLTKNAGAITNNALNTMVITGTLTGTAPLSNAGTVSSTGTISSSGSITNTGTVTSSGSLAGAGDFTNATAGSILNINGGTYTRSGALSNAGTINLNAGTFTTPASFTNTGTTNLNGGAIGNNYIVTSGTNTLNVNTSYTMQGTFANVTNLNVTNINNVQPTLTAGFGVTGVSTYTISPGASAVHSAALSGASATTSSISNYNSMTFNTGASITDFGVINLLRGSAGLNIPFTTGNLTFNSSVTMSGTRIQSTEPTSTLTINSPATLTTNAAISGVGTTTINPGATLALQSGGSITVTGYSSLLINGTLQILNGGTFTINPGDRISGASSGSIDTAGTFSLNGADLDFGGSFVNRPTGIFTIYGTPTINFDGAFTNEGMIIATFNSSNGLPRINIGSGALNLTNGTLAIGYQNNYIASGTYTFITAGSTLTSSDIGGYVLPQPSNYIRSWGLIVEDNSIKIQVERISFGEVATTPETKQIGAFMDQLGANNPNASALAVLNALEQITDPLALDAALLEISPPSYVQLQSLNMLDDVYVVVQSRIGGTRLGRRSALAYAAGDDKNSAELDNSVWLRPYGSSGRQHSEGNIIGYTARSNGIVFGVDNQTMPFMLVGVAGSISKSTVTDEVNLTSITRIKSYQAMIYGWLKSPTDAYLDWVISGGTNSYNGSRNMNFSTYNTTAEARYSGQQFAFKAMGSKSYVWKDLYQLTPMASAQYSFVRQMPYTETGAGDFNRIVEPNNINLFQLGVGGEFSVPFDQKNMVTIPAVHAMVLVDAKGGALETNTQFISGGPILYNSVQAGRIAIKAGASLTFNVSDRVEVVANYDFEHRSGYFSNEVFVNLRYTF